MKEETNSFRLSEGKSASRKRNTSRRTQSQSGEVDVVEVVLLQNRLNSLLLLGRNVRNNNVLIRGKSEDSLVDLGDLSKGGSEEFPRLVLNSTIFDEGGEVSSTVVSSLPSELIGVGSEFVRARRGEFPSESLFDLVDEVSQSHSIDRVLDSSVLSTVVRVVSA